MYALYVGERIQSLPSREAAEQPYAREIGGRSMGSGTKGEGLAQGVCGTSGQARQLVAVQELKVRIVA